MRQSAVTPGTGLQTVTCGSTSTCKVIGLLALSGMPGTKGVKAAESRTGAKEGTQAYQDLQEAAVEARNETRDRSVSQSVRASTMGVRKSRRGSDSAPGEEDTASVTSAPPVVNKRLVTDSRVQSVWQYQKW